MATARMRMLASKISCPEPRNSPAICPAKAATSAAPTTPAITPRLTQRARPATPLVAASTMPTIRPASMTSRKTIRRLASMALLGDHHALRGIGMVFAHEIVAARRERPEAHDAFIAASDDFFDMQCRGVEFLCAGILVREKDLRWHVRLHMDLGGGEFVIFECQRDRRIARECRERQKRNRGRADAGSYK